MTIFREREREREGEKEREEERGGKIERRAVPAPSPPYSVEGVGYGVRHHRRGGSNGRRIGGSRGVGGGFRSRGRAEGRGIAGDPQATARVSRPAGRRRRPRRWTIDAGTLVTHTNLAL